jgi:hypothetical protein
MCSSQEGFLIFSFLDVPLTVLTVKCYNFTEFPHCTSVLIFKVIVSQRSRIQQQTVNTFHDHSFYSCKAWKMNPALALNALLLLIAALASGVGGFTSIALPPARATNSRRFMSTTEE